MKVKVGQYARYEITNSIYKVSVYDENDCILISLDGKREFSVNPKYINVADTPQELIQVGDLIQTNEMKFPAPVEYVNKHDYLEMWTNLGLVDFKQETITKILTPNSKGGYDLQWEDKNE